MNKDSLVAVGLAGLLVGGTWFARLWYWMYFWIAVTILLALAEWYSKKKTGLTISQRMQKLHKEKPALFWLVWGIYAAFFVVLLVHLAS